MKYIYLATSFFIFFTATAQSSKIRIGFDLGVSKPITITNGEFYNYVSQPLRPSGNLILSRKLDNNFSLFTGIGYMSYKFTRDISHLAFQSTNNQEYFDEEVEAFHYLMIPVDFTFHSKIKGLHFLFGFSNKILLDYSSYYHNLDSKNRESTEFQSAVKSYIPALDLGINYQLKLIDEMRLTISIIHSIDLLDIYNFDRDKGYYFITMAHSFQIGFIF